MTESEQASKQTTDRTNERTRKEMKPKHEVRSIKIRYKPIRLRSFDWYFTFKYIERRHSKILFVVIVAIIVVVDVVVVVALSSSF